MTKNIIKLLTSQHNNLKKILLEIKKLSTKDNPDYSAIIKKQETFKKLLTEHLDTENNILYPRILKEYNKKNISGIKSLIYEMKEIETNVNNFLEKYKTSSIIQKQINQYIPELIDIIETFSIRMESEKDALFIAWDMIERNK